MSHIPDQRHVWCETGLGVHTVSSTSLLKELTGRDDLAKALQETGLGSGTDFNCPQDESPRDGGCQVKCGSRDCARAHQACRKISHCVSVDVNRDRTWGTLKSLQVYTPRPVPTCDGYVFDAAGGAPQPLAAPAEVEFEVSSPREDWCYRDTGFSKSAQALYRANEPGRSCTMEDCFDASRCRSPSGSHSPALSLFIGVEIPKGKDMVRLPRCLRQAQRTTVVDAVEAACLVLPTVNMNCEWDQCDPSTHALLRALPSWGDGGRNHIIWVPAAQQNPSHPSCWYPFPDGALRWSGSHHR